MKFLGWMHRKFRQNSADFTSGYPCNCLSGRQSLEESRHEYYSYQKPLRPILDDQFLFPAEEENPPAEDEIFHGLLAIGTLGSLEPAEEDDPPAGSVTPTFGVSVDDIAEKEEGCEATEDDLMLINAEIEKELLEKTERLSSARASHVSAKQLVVTGCPLQEYLFGSFVESAAEAAAEAAAAEAKLKKEEHHRTSLGDLFMAEEEEEEEKEKPTPAMHLIVKKMLKRRAPVSSSRTATCHIPTCQSNPETKFQKILQMFQKKVHPESHGTAKKAAKFRSKNSVKSRGHAVSFDKSSVNTRLSTSDPICKNDDLSGTTVAVAWTDVGGGNCNREHWIKTDADYLVLEL